MIRNFLVLILFSIFSFCNEDALLVQKQNTLYVNNLIEIEEKIAYNFEKFLLAEFKIPSMDDLVSNEYLGSNFSLANRMGDNIAFNNALDLKIKYAISKADFTNAQGYIVQLYNRDLYRDYTTVNYTVLDNGKIDTTTSYIEFRLKSAEANTIYNLLKSGAIIEKSCSASLTNKYCNNDKKSIRYYNANSNYIEYDKKDFNNGNVIVSVESLLTSEAQRLNKLKVGSYIFIKDKTKNVKTSIYVDDNSVFQYLKVD